MTTAMLCDSFSTTFFGSVVPFAELTPEASSRRYFRPQSKVSPLPQFGQAVEKAWLLVVAADQPPTATTDFLLRQKIRVPLLGPSCEGAYLVEDLGDQHLAHLPTVENYRNLCASWHRFSQASLPSQHPNASLRLDATLFQRELDMFLRRYLEAYRGFSFSNKSRQEIETACQNMATQAAKGPQCLQHRDFHSRNVLLMATGDIAWIDHQDLRQGPLFYDLASLFTDAYVDLSDSVYQLLEQNKFELGTRFQLSSDQTQELFLHCALQRVLKALGTFGHLLADGRRDYLQAEQRARPMALALCDMHPTAETRLLRKVFSG